MVCTTARNRLLPSAYTLPHRVRRCFSSCWPGTESVSDWFLGYSYVSFLFCASLSRTFFSIERYKKAPRAVRGSLAVSFDGMILAHFCSVCIRVFRQGARMIVLLSLEVRYCLAICCTVPRIVSPAVAKRIHRCFSLCRSGN